MDIFDLEQEIMKCWNVVDDIRDCIHYLDSWPNANDEDKRNNILLGMAALYQMRFERLWECFEDTTGEYHRMRRSLDDNAK